MLFYLNHLVRINLESYSTMIIIIPNFANLRTGGIPNCNCAKNAIDLVILGTILDKTAKAEADAKDVFVEFVMTEIIDINIIIRADDSMDICIIFDVVN